MSAFDDEFGLFDDDTRRHDDDERRSTLGARLISTGETVIDEIEMDDDERPRGRIRRGEASNGHPLSRRPRRFDERRPAGDPNVLRERAVELLAFLAKGLVAKPEVIAVAAHDDARQGILLELEVSADDLGKVIGRGGRVAQALRTIVRAAAEGRVAIEIIDIPAPSTAESDVVFEVVELPAAEEPQPAAKKPRAKRTRRPRVPKDPGVDEAAPTASEPMTLAETTEA